jgi:hypothetical protein
MADEEIEDDESEDTEGAGGTEDESQEAEATEDGEETQDVTAPGDWERKPADEEDLRHDDSSEPLAEPLGDDADDDLAEQEAGDVTPNDEDGDEDENFDRPDPPDEAGLEDTGGALERHSEPLLEGSEVRSPVGALPTRSLLAMAVFVLVFCAAFFALWGLLGNIGILLGLIAGTALGLGAMKLMADRAA